MMKAPIVLGGSECDPVTQLEVIEALAAINSSAAWCTMVGATSLGMPGAFLPDDGVARMFAGAAHPRGAILVSATGVATPVAGGYRLQGRWAFASGVRHAEWVTVVARVPRAAPAEPAIHVLVLPAAECLIQDNWQVTGLKGTGSCDIVVSDVFVPLEMSWNAQTDGPRRGGALYRLGLPAFVANEHAGFALGLARRALDGLTAIAQAKRRGYSSNAITMADRGTVQRLLGRAEMRLRAARGLAFAVNEEAWATVCAGQVLSLEQQTATRSAAVYATEVAAEIVTESFRYAGGSAIYQGHFMQRCLRDINVAAQHFMVSDTAYELLGRVRLGFTDLDPMS